MTLDFGSIKSYNTDRGFGFVCHTLFNANSAVFFHIRKIKIKYPKLARQLDNGEACNEVKFWYKVEKDKKGEQVSHLWLSKENIPPSYANELYDLIKKVESIWKNVNFLKPDWLDFVTIELLGVERRHELSVERDNLESQLRATEEERRMGAEVLRKKEIRRIADEHNLREAKADELEKLLTEMRPFNFTHSKQLSAYIVKHKLGYRYPNISGIVRMEEAGTQWNFHGGFPPDIYRIICDELNLDNQRTAARPIDFEPFSRIYSTN
ncbi:MAG: cold-shock protein [Limnospira sp.]